MPEGDTIFRTADGAPRRAGGPAHHGGARAAAAGLRRVPDLSRLVGATVASVEARGKHLLIGFDNGLTLRSHLRMSGSWHRYRPGEPWRRPRARRAPILETAESVAVAFNTPVVELLTAAGPAPIAAADDARAGPARRATSTPTRRCAGSASATASSSATRCSTSARWRGSATSTRARSRSSSGWTRGRRSAAFDDEELLARAAHRAAAAPGQHARRRARHHRQPGARPGAVGLRAGRAAVPALRDARSRPRRQGELARLTYWCPRCQPRDRR